MSGHVGRESPSTAGRLALRDNGEAVGQPADASFAAEAATRGGDGGVSLALLQ
jgi:hypothetical protein